MTKEEFISEISDKQAALRRFLLVLCRGDAFTADDIAQDSCIKAWIAVDSFRGKSSFSTWLFRIAYNCWCDRHYDSCGEDIGQAATRLKAESGLDDNSFRYQSLYQAIDSLKSKEKAAILLFYMEDRSIKEISDILGIPKGSVKSLLSRGRANLKLKLK